MKIHEQLKEIADKIWYEYWNDFDYSFYLAYDEIIVHTKIYETWFYWSNANWEAYLCNIREIIFTTEFMGKYVAHYCIIKNYCHAHKYLQYDVIDIFNNLDNPVEFLHNLLFNK